MATYEIFVKRGEPAPDRFRGWRRAYERLAPRAQRPAKITIPNSWNKLTRRQILRLIAIQNHPRYTFAQQKLLILYRVFGLKARYFRQFTTLQMANFTLPLSYFWDHTDLTNQILPTFRIHFTRYYGPESHLKNVLFGEFVVCDRYFTAYLKHQAPSALYGLIATLYRPKNPIPPSAQHPAPDIREPFTDKKLAARLKKVNRLSANKQNAILYFYSGCRQAMANKYPHVFGNTINGRAKSDEERELDDPGDPGHGSGTGGGGDWLDFMRNLPNDKFGNLEQIEQTPVHVIFFHANKMMEESLKQRYKNKKLTSNL